MARYLELCADREEELCCAARALSSPVRLRILRLLSSRTLNVKEIAAELGLPASSTAVNVRLLEEAGLIETCQQPGEHGAMKLCSRSCDLVTVRLTGEPMPESSVYTVHMPVGNFTDCEVVPSCGLGTETGKIGQPDRKESFYLPERTGAQILWSSGGYVEYRFPNPVPAGRKSQKSVSPWSCARKRPVPGKTGRRISPCGLTGRTAACGPARGFRKPAGTADTGLGFRLEQPVRAADHLDRDGRGLFCQWTANRRYFPETSGTGRKPGDCHAGGKQSGGSPSGRF